MEQPCGPLLLVCRQLSAHREEWEDEGGPNLLAECVAHRESRTHHSIAVVEAQSQALGRNLGLDGIFFGLSPWHRDDLGVILPGLFRKNRSHKEPHVLN